MNLSERYASHPDLPMSMFEELVKRYELTNDDGEVVLHCYDFLDGSAYQYDWIKMSERASMIELAQQAYPDATNPLDELIRFYLAQEEVF